MNMPKILAIDDNVEYLKVITTLLEKFIPDSIVVTAESGYDGIEMARKEFPDVILLDIKMPGINGYEVCKGLKEDDNTKNIPIIMLTGLRTEANDRVRALDIGADAFLSKPIDKSELIAQINVMLRIKKAEEELSKERYTLEQMVQDRTEDLHAERSNLYNIIESIADGIYIVNRHYDIQYVNSILEKDFGPYEGVKCYKYLYNRDDVCSWCKNQDVLNGENVRWELQSSHNNKNYDIIEIPLINTGGCVLILKVLRDITDRR
ncbi:MAG: response regulator [Spirochaetota bacterium]|nr:response regulator [Spirochaetota bacterium]